MQKTFVTSKCGFKKKSFIICSLLKSSILEYYLSNVSIIEIYIRETRRKQVNRELFDLVKAKYKLFDILNT